ncbi:MAG: ABC transporter substrate-binding protein [Pseudothermotoga sp.]|uniref:ABC transporter substrate-binding protein n=1 Tax=Pseudothermotoga sp. TaxID=2033661 RepID=UPI000E8A756B|nr:ABC transporter substrate-binding protein [Pseudothermotoga sp.]HBT39046.1 hypothetical protein [Pseudothermotoga sp.]
MRLVFRIVLVTAILLLLLPTISLSKTKIIFWHMYDSGPGKEVMDEIIGRFNANNTLGIEVEALAISFWDYWDKLGVAMAAGQEPDIFMHDLGNVPSRAYKGVLADLTPYIKAKGIVPEKSFFTVPLNMCKWEDKFYALPFETDVRLLYWNKDLFKQAGLDPDKPPSTWQELWEYASKIDKKSPQGTYDVLGFNPIYGQSYFWMYVWGTGGTFLDNKGNISVNNPTVVKALEEWIGMLNKLGIKELEQFNATYGWGADAFLAGKLGMVIQVGQYAAIIKIFAPNLNYGVTHIPYPVKATWSNGFSLEVSSRSKNKDAAAEFALYLVSKEVQLMMAQRLNSLVCNIEAAKDPSLMQNPEWRLQVEALEYSQFRPFVLEAPVWYEELQKAVDEVRLGRKPAKKALDDAQKLIESEIQKFRLTNKK